ncbi:MAG TPA: ABC transporter ATP-binding protein [Thermodesulfobacteriota bacterium]|nr:ABC transporter ATP-binding protein [Thermodesulfobacteriota bacterium]
MLEIEKINVSYGDLQILWDISLKVEEKDIVGLIGPNGAGKTTTLRTITGLLKPFAGGIEFEGVPMEKVPIHKRVELGISLIPEGRGLFPGMSTLENLELGAFTAKGRTCKDRTLEQVYELFPILKNRRKQTAGTMSGGEQQMLAIGRALMSKPKLLLVDEPSWGLSPLLSKLIYEVIGQINHSGVTILLIEQNVRIALELTHRAYVIENGRIVKQGDSRNMFDDQHIREAYLGTESV